MSKVLTESPVSLNARLNLWGENHTIQFDADREAARQYFLQEVNPNTVFFHSLEEKLEFLFDNGYYNKRIYENYNPDFVKALYKKAYAYHYRFKSYVGALKFYRSYALKTFDGERFLERFEDRVVVVALDLADGDVGLAENLVDAMMRGALQPATPTFMNAGRKDSGERVSCFLLNTSDSLESIMATLTQAAQLSKRGGGIGINLTDVRAAGDPIKGVKGASSGVLPYAKVLEDTGSYVNQLGQRAGSFVVYIHAHHLDVLDLLDSKKENADEKRRLKTLSIGIVVPDITYELAAKGEDMYLFSPYDVSQVYGVPFSDVDVTAEYRNMVENPAIRKKKTSARGFLQLLASLRYESGYPYIINIDTANRESKVAGKIKMSNLCSEILQPQTDSTFNEDGSFATVGRDVSCNLASLNVARAMEFGTNLPTLVDTAIRGLTAVSDMTDIKAAPTVRAGNRANHSVGLGQMGLAGFFGKEEMYYGDEDSIEFTSAYFSTIAFWAYHASAMIAKERGETFEGFENSKYATGEAFDKYIHTDYTPKREKVRAIFEKYGVEVPDTTAWLGLQTVVQTYGLYNSHTSAVAPTGSISYSSHSTSSIHPITAKVESRSEGKLGRVYFPAPEMTNENQQYFVDAYEVGWKAVIDVYAAAAPHVDQALSMTLFYSSNSMKEMVNSIIYAHKKGLKSIYYARLKQQALDGTAPEECVSCSV